MQKRAPECRQASSFSMDQDVITQTEILLVEGMSLSKCRKCQCMKDALDTVSSSLRSPLMRQFACLKDRTDAWTRQMEPIGYS